MNNVLILLDNLDDWKPYYETSSVLTVSDYLKNKPVEKDRKLVINLSDDYSYNSEGYYCSLLAQTRGQKVIPDVDIINKLETGTGVRMDRSLQALCYQWIQKNNVKDDIWYLNIYFGKCREKGLERIARFIFENYPCPLLRVALNTHPRNQIESIQFLPLNRLNDEEQDFFANTLDNFNKKIWRAPKSAKASRYSLAVLVDPQEKFPPSNKGALHKLAEVAKKMNIHVEMITEDDCKTCFHNLRNFFFLFHSCSYTSNKTDKAIANAAFDVYHTKSEMDFKYVISDVFRELSKFISSSTVDELMFTTSSMHYSLKNSAYKSNHRIVKYILYCLYMPDQRDTVLDQSRLTIEHLLNDDGSVRNSSIYNLTLTSGEINSNELKNRGLVEKIGILKSQSSVIANQKLDEYLDAQGEYLEDKRKNDLKEQAISNVFKYEGSPFGYTKEMVDGYLKMKRALQSDEELLAVLLERGMNIQAYLSNNPAMQDAYNRFLTLCGTTS